MTYRILIMGANGFSGRNFVKSLCLSNLEIHAVDQINKFPSNWDNIKTYQIDLSEKHAIERLLEHIQPHYIVNFCGKTNAPTLSDYLRANVDVSDHILDWASGLGKKTIRRILLIGSAAEYGMPSQNPVSETSELKPYTFYGLSKVIQTEVAMFYSNYKSVPVIVARTFNLFGLGLPRHLAVGNWEHSIKKAKNGDLISVGNLKAQRDYINIEDAVNDYLIILFFGDIGQIYNVCSGKPVEMKLILERLLEISKKSLSPVEDKSRMKKCDTPLIFGDRTKLEKLYEKIGKNKKKPWMVI